MIAFVRGTSTRPQELAEDLLAVLGYMLKSTQSDVFRTAATLELSLSQLRALHVLDAAEHDLALHELAERVGLSVAAAGRAIDGLVRLELVTRREDPVDRRVKRIAVSPGGREIILRLVAARREALLKLTASLGDDEREALSRALAPVLARPEIDVVRKGIRA
jgi:DNA-binding MarR family transcriptional regulator